MGLYQKYRPSTLEEMKGNRNIISSLKGLFKNPEKIPHSFLFVGPTGCGKTSLARIAANELGCTPNNVIEIDTAQFTGIDTVRDIRASSKFIPLGGGIRVYIIDEVHRMTGDAQNAFLKILEDTPSRVYFILCTTNENSLLGTIRGRCSRFEVSLLSDKEMTALVTEIAEKEGETLKEEVIEQIVINGLGHPRDTINILEQVLATPEKRRLATAQKSQLLQSEGKELCQALLKGAGWKKVNVILKGLKEQDPEGIRRIVLGYMSAVLLNSDNERAGLILECFEEPFYNGGFPLLVSSCYKIIKG